MFARLYVYLGFNVVVQPDDKYEPIEVEEDGLRIVIYPPFKSQVAPSDLDAFSSAPITDVSRERLIPADDPPRPVSVDERPAVVADALRVDIFGAALTRSKGTIEDPSFRPALAVINRFLGRLRLVSQVPFVRAADNYLFWHFRYLDDDGSEFEQDPAQARGRFAASWRMQAMPILTADGLWEMLRDLDDAEPLPAWEQLYLDARFLWDSDQHRSTMGPALVLAFSSIETRIDDVLSVLASGHEETTRRLGVGIRTLAEILADGFDHRKDVRCVSCVLRAILEGRQHVVGGISEPTRCSEQLCTSRAGADWR